MGSNSVGKTPVQRLTIEENWRKAATASRTLFLLLAIVLGSLFLVLGAVYCLSNVCSLWVVLGTVLICASGILCMILALFVSAAMRSEGKVLGNNRENALLVTKLCSILLTAIGAVSAVLAIVM